MDDSGCMRQGSGSPAGERRKLFCGQTLRRFPPRCHAASLITLLVAANAGGQLPPGGIVTEIFGPRPASSPALNDNREVVFFARTADGGAEIYRFLGGKLEQLTGDSYLHSSPDINNPGHIVWIRNTKEEPEAEVMLYRDEDLERITETPEFEQTPRINNQGQMAWEQWSLDHATKEIFFFDPEAGDPVMITDGDPLQFNFAPRMNDTGATVWLQVEEQWGILNGPNRVMRYFEGEAQPISGGLGRGERFVTPPAISETGDVYWADKTGSPLGPVLRWRDGEITEVLPFGLPTASNARGDLLFRTGGNAGMTWLYRNGVFYQAFDGMTAIGGSYINAHGDAVGHGYAEAPRDIFLLTIDAIAGDHDEDGDLDIDDLAGLSDCLAGPGEGLRDEACARADFNEDGHVDLRDVASFGTDFTGDCALGITTPPGGQDVCIGDEVRMDIDVRGWVASYQWTLEREPIAGATDREYVIDRAELSDLGEYGVIVTSECGWESRSDKRHHLTVHRDPPTFSTQPDSQEACRGQDIQFRSLMGGNNEEPYGFVTFQWQKDGVDLAGENWFLLVIRDVDEDDEGEYRCVATNACGVTISRTATLTLAPDDAPPRILIQPRDVQVDPGQPASFNVLTACADSFQWKKDGVELPGETRSDLFIFPVTCDDAADYTVTAINTHGQVTSDPARLTVNNCP